MPSGDVRGGGSKFHSMMAGVEAGVLGGLFMMAWLGLLSVFEGRSIWSVPNLLASTFYGEAALRRGFRWTTLSGLALHLIVSATAGLLFGLAVSGIVSRGRVMLLGLTAGAVWYFLTLGVFWKYVNPMVPLYTRGGGMFLAHVGMGFFLGSFPRYLHALKTEPATHGSQPLPQ
jgi:hypothetical protein